MKENKTNTRPKFRKKEFEIQLISDDAIIPAKAVRGAIGYDLCVPRDFHVPAHARVAVPLDIAINLPAGVEAKIEPRSGCSLRGIEGYGKRTIVTGKILGLFQRKKIQSGKMFFDADVAVGKIDPNYTGNIHVIIINRDEAFLIRKGTRIAQLTFYQTISPFFKPVDELSCKSRGGGLGHTGIDRLHGLNGTRGLADRLPGPASHITHTSASEKLRHLLNRKKSSEANSQSCIEQSQVKAIAPEDNVAADPEEDTDEEKLDMTGSEDYAPNIDTPRRLTNDGEDDTDPDKYGVHV